MRFVSEERKRHLVGAWESESACREVEEKAEEGLYWGVLGVPFVPRLSNHLRYLSNHLCRGDLYTLHSHGDKMGIVRLYLRHVEDCTAATARERHYDALGGEACARFLRSKAQLLVATLATSIAR